MSENTIKTATKAAAPAKTEAPAAPCFNAKHRFVAPKAAPLPASKAKPQVITVAFDEKNHACKAEQERAAKVIATAEFTELFGGLESGILGLDQALSRLCFKALAEAYKNKCPTVVTLVLARIRASGVLSRHAMWARRYFEDGGIEFWDRPVYEARAIVDYKRQRVQLERMKGVSIQAYAKDEKASAKRAQEEEDRVEGGHYEQRAIEALNTLQKRAADRAASLVKTGGKEAENKIEFYKNEKSLCAAGGLLVAWIAEHPKADLQKVIATLNSAYNLGGLTNKADK